MAYKKTDYTDFEVNKDLKISVGSQGTSYGFKHEGFLTRSPWEKIAFAKCTYYNRTWESFKYESLLQKLLANAKKDKAINEEEEQDFKKMIENGGEKEKNEFGLLKMFSALNKIENNDLKKRNECDIKILKATMGEGLDIPANWDDLEEETKRERLDKIMSAI